jgi:hypothetical protein
MKRYKISVFKKLQTGEILIACIKASWLPEDNERFMWELGGDRIEIVEIESPLSINIPQQN